MAKTFLLVAAVLGFTGVALGAFGAHGLQATLEADGRVDTFETANRYHLTHALGLLMVGVWLATPGGAALKNRLRWAGYGFIAGTLLFSGSLYILAIFDLGLMGAVAPLGGLGLLLGWAAVGWAAWKSAG
ncbi:MAG: DUF423 domain-containing protein [bacterium]|nr:DUF423 domain-containing protein [bacterium]